MDLRTKRLCAPMELAWEDGDPAWKLIIEDSQIAEEASAV
jgi:hypothetical protein